jgi:tetratricopeptide (TPR) repeat protein
MFRALIRVSIIAAFAIPVAACAKPAVPASVVPDVPEPPVPDPKEEARAAAEAAYRKHLDDGTKTLAAGKPDEAIPHLKLAMSAKSDGAEAYYQLGRAFLAKKNDPEARKALTEAIRLDAQHADAYMERAALHERAGRLNDATFDYRQVIAIDNISETIVARAHWLRSDIMNRLGKRSDYRYDRKRAMELDPEYKKLVTAGDVCVHNHTEKKVTIKFEKFVNPDGTLRTFSSSSHFVIPDEKAVFLLDGDQPLAARSVRYTVSDEVVTSTFEQVYKSGVTLDIFIEDEHFGRK